MHKGKISRIKGPNESRYTIYGSGGLLDNTASELVKELRSKVPRTNRDLKLSEDGQSLKALSDAQFFEFIKRYLKPLLAKDESVTLRNQFGSFCSLYNKPFYLPGLRELVSTIESGTIDTENSGTFKNESLLGINLNDFRLLFLEFLSYIQAYSLSNPDDANKRVASNSISRILNRYLLESKKHGHTHRVNILKEKFGPLLSIIQRYPTLRNTFLTIANSSQGGLVLPAAQHKQDRAFTFTDNTLPRQLSAFLSAISRNPELRALFTTELMTIAREQSNKLRARLESSAQPVDIAQLCVGLGVNAGIYAESQFMLIPELAKNTLFIGKESYLGGEFAMGGVMNQEGFGVNSRRRRYDVFKKSLPLSPGSLNPSGPFSMLAESDMGSSDYGNDADRAREIAIKFFFHANYLMDADLIYQKQDPNGRRYVSHISNTKTNTVITIKTPKPAKLFTGSGTPALGFTKFDDETNNQVNEKEFDIDMICKDILNFMKTKEYIKGIQVPFKKAFPNTPTYFTSKQLLIISKALPDIWKILISGRKITMTGTGDNEGVVKEAILVNKNTYPTQAIKPCTIIEISPIASGKNTRSPSKIRGRYARKVNYSQRKDFIADNNQAYPIVGKTRQLLPQDPDGLFKVNVSLREPLDFVNIFDNQLLNVVDPIENKPTSLTYKSDLIVDCSGLVKDDNNKSSILIDNSETALTTQKGFKAKLVRALNTTGSIISLLSDTEIIIKSNNPQYSIIGVFDPKQNTYREFTIAKSTLLDLLTGIKKSSIPTYEDYTYSKPWMSLLSLLNINIRNDDDITPLKVQFFNTADFKQKTGEDYKVEDFLYGNNRDEKVFEILNARFGAGPIDTLTLARLLTDDRGNSAERYGPAANLPLSPAEKRLLIDIIGITANTVARFRFEPRILASLLDNVLSKRKAALTERMTYFELAPEQEYTIINTERAKLQSNLSFGYANIIDPDPSLYQLHHCGFEHNLEAYVLTEIARVMDIIALQPNNPSSGSLPLIFTIEISKLEANSAYNLSLQPENKGLIASLTGNGQSELFSKATLSIMQELLEKNDLIRAYFVDMVLNSKNKKQGTAQISIPFTNKTKALTSKEAVEQLGNRSKNELLTIINQREAILKRIRVLREDEPKTKKNEELTERLIAQLNSGNFRIPNTFKKQIENALVTQPFFILDIKSPEFAITFSEGNKI